METPTRIMVLAANHEHSRADMSLELGGKPTHKAAVRGPGLKAAAEDVELPRPQARLSVTSARQFGRMTL